MTMGPWGQHYERTQTWWEWLRPWHEYLARCQFLLRQGRFVADICYLQAESPPQGFANHPRKGYDWDDCSADVVLKRLSVRNGRLELPDGMSYRVLVLPDTRTMTPGLLRKIKDLVEAGATVIGTAPQKSPGLSGYPACDVEVRQLAAELWGDCDGTKVKARQFGQGRIVWTTEAEGVLRQAGVAEDFLCDQPWHYLHRAVDGADLYFVANPSRTASTPPPLSESLARYLNCGGRSQVAGSWRRCFRRRTAARGSRLRWNPAVPYSWSSEPPPAAATRSSP